MGEKPEEKKEVKKEEQKQMLHLDLDINKLFEEVKVVPIPDNQKIWEKPEDMSEDYKNLNKTLQTLAVFLAYSCNTGPEVKDNSNKRTILARQVLDAFISNLGISGYSCYGMISELQHDLWMRVNGRKHVVEAISLVNMIEDFKKKKALEQSLSEYAR